MNIQFPTGSGIEGFVYWLIANIMDWGWVSYGFAIVFFTLFIKLMLSPLDFLNRFFYYHHKSSRYPSVISSCTMARICAADNFA